MYVLYQWKLAPSLLRCMGTVRKLMTLSGIPSALNPVNARILCVGNYYSSTKAVNELDLPQTPVDRDIEDALDWFAHCGMVKP